MYKKINMRQNARDLMLNGINAVADAVSATMGPNGKVAVLSTGAITKTTKDGVSVAKAINLANKQENAGAQIILQAANKVNDTAGDGTTTVSVLSRAIANAGNKRLLGGYKANDLKVGIDRAKEQVLQSIKNNVKKISSKEELAQVATISANGDAEIGEMVAKAVHQIGFESPITVEEGKGRDTELTIVEGMSFDRGYISPYFVTNSEKMISELNNPYILIYDQKISAMQPILPLLEEVVKSGRSLLIIADDVEGEALATLSVNSLRGSIKVAAVKAPGFGDRKNAMLADISTITGGQVVSADLGTSLDNVKIETLGSAKKVVISKDETIIVDGLGSEGAVKERCAMLRQQISETVSDYDREKLQERLAKLSGGVAVLSVGGASEIEMKEKKDRVQDAVYATKAAAEEGVVAGSGITLLRSIEAARKAKFENKDQEQGIEIVCDALKSPIMQILSNAGINGEVVVAEILKSDNIRYGYDAKSMEFCDMHERGIVDPLKVVRIALQTACSVSSMFLLTDVLITDEDSAAGSGNAGGGMGAPGLGMI